MRQVVLISVIAMMITGCGSYRRNIMFTVDDDTAISTAVADAEKNYTIQRNDFLKLKVYTNKGELLIDPDYQLLKEIPTQSLAQRPDPLYLVNTEGVAKLPMIGEIRIEGFTIREAEAVLQKEYTKFYADAFVKLNYANKRVIVLGSTGGKLIPLENENMRLTEVLAVAGGLDNNSIASSIRVMRGSEVFVADFSKASGFQANNILMQPGDVVYVEPIRRPLSEGVRDYGPILSILTSVTTLIIVIIGL